MYIAITKELKMCVVHKWASGAGVHPAMSGGEPDVERSGGGALRQGTGRRSQRGSADIQQSKDQGATSKGDPFPRSAFHSEGKRGS